MSKSPYNSMVIFIYTEVLGINLSYKEEGAGEDIILLHGWGANSNTFNRIINELKDNYHVIAIDLPGFGDTVIYKPLNVYEVANILYQFLVIKGITNPIIIGHSYGARIAIIYASKYYVSKLVIVGGAGIKKRLPIRKRFSIRVYKILKKLKINLNLGSEDYKKSNQILKKMLVNAVNTDLRCCMKKITTPTILIYGKNDEETDRYVSEEIHKNISSSSLIYLENCGHFLYLEQPNIFLLILNSFLNGG